MDSVYLYNKSGTTDLLRWVGVQGENRLGLRQSGIAEGIWETRGGRQKVPIITAPDVLGGGRTGHSDVSQFTTARPPIERIGAGCEMRSTPPSWGGLVDKRQAFVSTRREGLPFFSVLMMPLAKFISPTDPKWLSTLDKAGQQRWSRTLWWAATTPRASPDGLRGQEGTFTVCCSVGISRH